ncbi:MAG: tRNA preQ1(34) S-adenosylmethionine ribosyltransferase-isomerase QueA [Deltaproteobacteria bacterium]|nr:tRNA preQ1(34) S-adenosylmethionine ribosyltransferase-isomerase QueA [Deltaproteobacteria bacterium]
MTDPTHESSLDDFDFELPDHLIARHPLEARDASRLLVVDRRTQRFRDAIFRDLPELLSPKDLLVVNESKVFPARLSAKKRSSGGRADLLLVEALDSEERRFSAMATGSKSLRPGTELIVSAGGSAATLTVERALGEGFVEVFLPEPAPSFLARFGQVPLPPYLGRAAEPEDVQRYQTVYARDDRRGSVAAPTAGLHFTQQTLDTLSAKGIGRVSVTLHVGPGTFLPIRASRLSDHVMHAERFEIPEETIASIEETKRAGGRVVAVGTTVVRTLESRRPLMAGAGSTKIFIKPGFVLSTVDVLVTNFHLPKSTLVVLVASILGPELWRAAYRHAVDSGYRFFSYGDAMVIL